MKKFCNNCVFFKTLNYRIVTYYHNTKIRVVNSEICCHNVKVVKILSNLSLKIRKTYTLLVDDPNIVNNTNECEFYKEKFFSRCIAKIIRKDFLWVD